MTITIDTTNPRSLKAIRIEADASQWLKCRTRDGRELYGVPASEPGRYYLVNCEQCDCPDFQQRDGPCKHMLAVQLHCARASAQAVRKADRRRKAATAAEVERRKAASALYAEIYGTDGDDGRA